MDLERPALMRPYLLVRVAGLPERAVSEWSSPELVAALARVAFLDATANDECGRLSDGLYAAIGRVGDRKHRGRLLELRRLLFRGVVPPSALVASAGAALPDDLRQRVESAVAALRGREASEEEVRTTHTKALRRAREHFQRTLGDPDFQKGLLLSSRALFGNLARYRAARPERLTSRDEQVERGLLRYMTRAAMKATPFARFCSVTTTVWADHTAADGTPVLSFDADPSAKRGHVRLNKALYSLLWTHLKARAGVRRTLALDLNPTLGIDGGRLSFLAVMNGREVFQRLVSTESLDAVLKYVRTQPGATVAQLSTGLAGDPAVDATPAEAEAYLEALVAHGLLRFRSFVPEQSADWDAPLRVALAGIDDPHAQRVASVLAEVRDLADRYAVADVPARDDLSERIRGALAAAFADLGLSAEAPGVLPLYEDASTDARLRVPATAAIDAAFTELGDWMRLTRPLAHPRAEQATMRHFFDQRYPAVVAVPLLAFYETYYREHLKGHLENSLKVSRGVAGPELAGYDFVNPLGVERVHALREAARRLTARTGEAWAAAPAAESVTIDPAVVRDALHDVSADAPATACQSASLFGQLALAPGGTGDVVLVAPRGHYFIGFGKYFSRFLYMLDDALQARVLADNTALAGEACLAEICGDAQFNGNLHPPLLPFELSYPTGESVSPAGQLPTADLDVVRDAEDPYALALVRRDTGERVLPVDLGFLSQQLRPPLYQLLTTFTPGGTFSLGIPDTLAPPHTSSPEPATAAEPGTPAAERPGDRPEEGDEGVPPSPHALPTAPAPAVVYRPRIVFGRSLVLARRRWTVPGVLVPRAEPIESAADYLLRLDRWRRGHGLPREGYVRVVPEPARPDEPASAGKRVPEEQPAAPVQGAAEASADTDFEAPTRGHPGTDAGTPEPAGDDATEPIRGAPAEGESVLAGNVTRPTGARPSRDWYKPQYIDFTNPLLVRLFARLSGPLTSYRLEIEERYPDARASANNAGDVYATELVIQLDFPGARADVTWAAQQEAAGFETGGADARR